MLLGTTEQLLSVPTLFISDPEHPFSYRFAVELTNSIRTSSDNIRTELAFDLCVCCETGFERQNYPKWFRSAKFADSSPKKE